MQVHMHNPNKGGRLLAPLHSHPNKGLRPHFIILDLRHFLVMLSLFYWAFNFLSSSIIIIIGFCWFFHSFGLSCCFQLCVLSHHWFPQKITIFSLTHFFKILEMWASVAYFHCWFSPLFCASFCWVTLCCTGFYHLIVDFQSSHLKKAVISS